MTGAVDSIETFGLVDGPGIRTVVFLSGCTLRCKFCHNPEMWVKGKENYTAEALAEKIIKNKNYFGDKGGVTFSGGEPILQSKFVIEVCKILKKENIHIALDTAGVGLGDYKEILDIIDLVLLDVKHTDNLNYQDLTGREIDHTLRFIEALNERGKEVWIRQVIVPGLHDNKEYLLSLNKFIKNIKNVTRIDFLPYHKLGSEKYVALKLNNPYEKMPEMDKLKCEELYSEFMKIYNEEITSES